MLEQQDFLFTIAQVAAAFVGFSLLIGVITARTRESELRRSLLYDVAQIGLFVIMGALVPYIVSLIFSSQTIAWRLSSLLLLLVTTIAPALSYRRINALVGFVGLANVTGKLLAVINPIVVIVVNLLFLWNVISPDENAATRYQAALLMMLLIATYLFLTSGFELRLDRADRRHKND